MAQNVFYIVFTKEDYEPSRNDYFTNLEAAKKHLIDNLRNEDSFFAYADQVGIKKMVSNEFGRFDEVSGRLEICTQFVDEARQIELINNFNI